MLGVSVLDDEAVTDSITKLDTITQIKVTAKIKILEKFTELIICFFKCFIRKVYDLKN